MSLSSILRSLLPPRSAVWLVVGLLAGFAGGTFVALRWLAPAQGWLAAVGQSFMMTQMATGQYAEGGYPAGEIYLCVHRKPDEKKARTWKLNGVTHDLMLRFRDSEDSVTQAVQRVATAREVAVDEAFIEGLCTVLADFIERGVILGCSAS